MKAMFKATHPAFRSALIVLAVGAGSTAYAVSPKKYELGTGVTVTPTMNVEESYDDNLLESGAENESGWRTTVAPRLQLEAVKGRATYQIGYNLNAQTTSSSALDDAVSHTVTGSAQIGITPANRLSINALYSRIENQTNTAVVAENDKLETRRAEAVYGIGRPSGRVSMDVGVNHTEFTTFNSGEINANREYDKPGATATIYVRVSPKVRALVDYAYDDYDYKVASDLDAEQDTVRVGLTWEATSRTTGTLKFGQQDRKFDNNPAGDIDGSNWSADITWEASRQDTLRLFTTKGLEDGSVDVTENVVNAERYGVTWDHQWQPHMYSNLFFNAADEDYYGSSGRSDDVVSYGVSLNFDIERWMTVGFGYTYKDRDSNLAERSSDRNIYMIRVNLSL